MRNGVEKYLSTDELHKLEADSFASSSDLSPVPCGTTVKSLVKKLEELLVANM